MTVQGRLSWLALKHPKGCFYFGWFQFLRTKLFIEANEVVERKGKIVE